MEQMQLNLNADIAAQWLFGSALVPLIFVSLAIGSPTVPRLSHVKELQVAL